MNSKKTAAYKHVLEFIEQNVITLKCRCFTTDYERSAQRSTNYPSRERFAWYFHFTQAVKQRDLPTLLKNDDARFVHIPNAMTFVRIMPTFLFGGAVFGVHNFWYYCFQTSSTKMFTSIIPESMHTESMHTINVTSGFDLLGFFVSCAATFFTMRVASGFALFHERRSCSTRKFEPLNASLRKHQSPTLNNSLHFSRMQSMSWFAQSHWFCSQKLNFRSMPS